MTEVPDDKLFLLFVESLKESLVKKGLDAIKPLLRQEIEEQFKRMEGVLRTRYDIQYNRMLVMLQLDGVKVYENG